VSGGAPAGATAYLDGISRLAVEAGDALSPGVYLILRTPDGVVTGSLNIVVAGESTMVDTLNAGKSVLDAAITKLNHTTG
jgi:hypothetical protein